MNHGEYKVFNKCFHVDGEFCKKCFNPDDSCHHPPLPKTRVPLCEHGMNPCCDVCHICRLEQSVSQLFKLNTTLLNQIADLKIAQEKLRSDSDKAVLTKHERPHCCPVCGGKGGFYISGTMDAECRACEGKGVLWK